ncbi:MerR family transcriptional regulator [Mycoplasmatota bacterium zrk1]
MRVKELANLAGITVRALHYYDQLGLLCPRKDQSNYRFYSKDDVAKLSQILYLRELGFPLSKIMLIIDKSNLDKRKALSTHRELIKKKIERLESLIESIDNTLEKGFEIDMIKRFSKKEFNKYKEEAIEKYGDAAIESHKKTDKFDDAKWSDVQKEMNEIFVMISKNMDKDISDSIIN